jgi:multisubunit Na+/H+ antiporter MnhC subunit
MRDWLIVCLTMLILFIAGKFSALVWHGNLFVIGLLILSVALSLYFAEWEKVKSEDMEE